jgi:hypothetical protein
LSLAEKKIEDLNPNTKTVLQALRSAIQIRENKNIPEQDRINRAKHVIRDVMHILGYIEDLVNK